MCESPSSRRAWIEIPHPGQVLGGTEVALLAEGVDRNCISALYSHRRNKSPSSRRAWIEIVPAGMRRGKRESPSSRRAWIEILHLHHGGRNRRKSPSSRRAWIEMTNSPLKSKTSGVALLAEGVDRNNELYADMSSVSVALLAEGVDRNLSTCRRSSRLRASPSSRRAWIEIGAHTADR